MFPSRPVPVLPRSACLVALMGLAFLEGCGGGGSNPPPAPPPVAPAISTPPDSLAVTAPQPASFSVTATGTAPMAYQWKKDGVNVGSNATTFSLSTTSASDEGSYTVTVSNAAGSATSAAAVLTVNPAPNVPAFSLQPASVSITEGQSAQFSVSVTGTPTPALAWQVSVNGGPWAGIGWTTPVLDILGATVADSGRQFRVVASNSAGTVSSSAATLTVTAAAVAPFFTTQPVNADVTAGQDASFLVAVGGTPAPTLQWQLSTDGGGTWADLPGATDLQFVEAGAALASNGKQFRAVATNAAGEVSSNAAILNVRSGAPLANIVYERQFGLQSTPSDLALVKEDGSDVVELTNSPDHEGFTSLAPGGRVIYRRFTGGSPGFYRVDADGTGTLFLAGIADPVVSHGTTPAGWLVYRVDTASTGRDLYAVDATSATPAPVPLATGTKHEDFAGITADGRVIYSVALSELHVINADGSNRIVLATEPGYYWGYRGETPSGLLILDRDNGYGSGGVYAIDGLGGSALPMAINTVPYEYEFKGITPTGQVIIRRMVGGQRDLYGNGTVPLAVSPEDEQYRASTASGKVIYQRTTSASKVDLYIVDADGTHTTRLSNSAGDDHFAALATDGRVIYSKVTAGQYDLYMVNADGTGTVPVANSADYEDFKGLTPGGVVIYERTGAGGVTQLYAFNPAGNVTTPLVTSGGHAFFVGTTPGGKVLFRRQSGNADLYIINADGTGITPLANTGNNEFLVAVFP